MRGQIVVFIGFNVAVRAKCDSGSGNTPTLSAPSPICIYVYLYIRSYLYRRAGEKPLLEANTDIFIIIISSGVGFLLFRVAKQPPPAFVCAFWAACIQPCQ